MTVKKLTPQEIHTAVKEAFGDAISDLESTEWQSGFTVVKKELWPEIAEFLRDNPALDFKYMACHTGVDYNDKDGTLGTIHNLESLTHKHKIAVKVKCTKAAPEVPSVALVWKTADWHEREAYDLLGIVYTGHPDLRRILCPDDWEGHPLRKDYKVQETYHGIKVPY
jgi:NADH-quinone oxidoreductase subunit C